MQIITKIKNALVTGLELAQIRLQMMSIDLLQFKNALLATLIAVLLAFVLLLISFISLLFGLDNLLAPEIKITVFFSISGIALLLVLILIFSVLKQLKKQRGFMSSTLLEIQRDVTALKNVINTSKKN